VTGLLVLAAYTLVFVLVTYRIARRTAMGVGGGGGKRPASRKGKTGEQYGGWQLPFLSPELSAVVEKELRYAVRNAQLRVIALMAVGLTVVLRLSPLGGGRAVQSSSWWAEAGPYAEGAGVVFSVLYIFTLVSPLTTNLFGYDGAGMRAMVLSPVGRRTMLVGKNIAATVVAAVLVVAGVFVGGLVFGDLNARVVLFAALAFVTFAALFAVCGNWLSISFPKRVEFGKRMNRSGVAGLLLIPMFFALLVPPAVSVLAAYAARSLALKYVILAAFAALSAGLYLLLVGRQGRALERRELQILEAVTGQGGEQDGQILG
jgi:ABC-type transport system involved in multi-copper enzyme maturation permease subunit